MSNVDQSNEDFRTALSFINQTGRHIFLTGRAGTGKTTFLRYIKEKGFKKMVVVAPTGVAAINAGGVTIHSFFQIPPGTYLPTQRSISENYDHKINNKHSLLKHLRMSGDKRDLMKELELLVIDEVSMVRADLLDAMDAVLRHVRQLPMLPFGGVQVLYIGDLFQLPPVVRHEEWKFLQEFYQSPFFFEAQVMQQAQPVYIELKKVYRQKDDVFISILNNIRDNCCSSEELEHLHRYYRPAFSASAEDHYITLTTHNDRADMINRYELQKLPGNFYQYKAEISGEFPDYSFPVEELLQLKIGAQIMFTKNDKGENRKYFNGKIGTIHSIEKEQLRVSFPNEASLLELKKETWENIRYTYNKEKDEIEEKELGTFTQYPIRLAWAITIHKSQGLTFDKAIIDAGSAFAAGQVYVALSRLTSLNGLVLKSRIHPHCIHTDERVLEFVKSELPADTLKLTLGKEQQEFICRSLLQRFGWGKILGLLRQHLEDYEHRQIPEKTRCIEGSMQLLQNVENLQEVSLKFQKQLEVLLVRCAEDQYKQLNERVGSACAYFIKQTDEQLIAPLDMQIASNRIKSRVGKYLRELLELKRQLQRRKQEFENISKMVASLQGAQKEDDILQAIENLHQPIVTNIPEAVPKKKRAEKGETNRISLQLFKGGKSIAEIATARSLAYSTIESHLTGFVFTGEIDVLELVNEIKLEKILEVLNAQPDLQSSAVKEQLGEEFSYGEIRAAMRFREKQNAAPLA